MDEKQLLGSISQKLNVLIALQVRSDVAQTNLSEKVGLLAGLGLSNSDIAAVTGASKGTVEVLKSRAKAGGKK